MAKFIKQQDKNYLSNEYDWYYVEGIITEDDLKQINLCQRKIILIIDNTKGQDPKIIEKVTSKNVSFSVVGGLDYFNKNKYKTMHYIKRTIIDPVALSKIIKFFEKLESGIRYSWTETQKCMYIYKKIVENFHYSYDNEPDYVNGKDVVRSLYGVLYNRLVCVGFTLVFKEAMDRIGIKCYYQNQQSHHGWNIVELDGKLRAIDLTWDCYGKGKDNFCHFNNFGIDKDFYKNKHHDLSYEADEKELPIVPFTVDEIRKNYKVITTDKNIEKRKMESLIDENGNKIYYFLLDDSKTIKQYIVYLDDSVFPIYSDLEPNKCLSKDKILTAIKYNNNHILPLKSDSKKSSKTYYRNDDSCFLIEKNKTLKNNMNELYFYDVITENNEFVLRRGVLLSELDLSLNYGQQITEIIANHMLSKERLAKKCHTIMVMLVMLENLEHFIMIKNLKQTN